MEEYCPIIVHTYSNSRMQRKERANVIYLIRNPGYANVYNKETSCNWSFRKSRSDVCVIRLDFDHFEIRAPANTGTCTDFFQATNAATGKKSSLGHHYQHIIFLGTTQGGHGKLLPMICGVNTGYILARIARY